MLWAGEQEMHLKDTQEGQIHQAWCPVKGVCDRVGPGRTGRAPAGADAGGWLGGWDWKCRFEWWEPEEKTWEE